MKLLLILLCVSLINATTWSNVPTWYVNYDITWSITSYPTADSVAFGTYSNKINSTGWADLQITSDE